MRGIQLDQAELPNRQHPPDAKSPLSHRQTWARQERFLAAYVTKGTIWKAAPLAGINRCTVQAWAFADTFGFNDRFADAVLDHQDKAQNWMVERIEDPKGNRGSDGLLSHYVNAVNPDKFRDRPQQNEDTQLKIAEALMKIAAMDRKQIAAANVIDESGNTVTK